MKLPELKIYKKYVIRIIAGVLVVRNMVWNRRLQQTYLQQRPLRALRVQRVPKKTAKNQIQKIPMLRAN